MKLNEFKAWFDGYTESLEGTPSKKQWERIKEQVKAIDGVPVTYPVYVDRYWRPYWGGPYWYTGNGVSSPTYSDITLLSSNTVGANTIGVNQAKFDGVGAMYLAGKAEAADGLGEV